MNSSVSRLTMADTEVFIDSVLGTVGETPPYNCTKVQILNQSRMNCSMGAQDDLFPYTYDEKVKYITLVSYMLTFFFGLTGNTLVIYIIWHFKKVRVKSVANYYIWNLAFADELFILALPIFCWATFTRHWPLSGILGTVSCKLSYVIRDLNKFSSIFLLVALSLDRCLASFHTLGSLRTNSVGKWVCVIIWVSCALIATPYLLYAQTITTFSGTSCRLAWPSQPLQHGFHYLRFWTYFQLIVGLLLPSTIIIASYLMLYIRLQNLQHRHQNSSVKRPSKKMTQTVLVVVITFILCQTPYHVLQIIAQGKVERVQEYSARGDKYLPPQSEVTTFVYLNLISQFLIFVSSCCNPIIYGLLNENYRRLYSEVLCCCHDRQSTESRRPTDIVDMETDTLKSPVQLKFQIQFHLPCDLYYWRRFWQWRKRGSHEKCIELERVTEIQCINGRDDIIEWQNSLPGSSLIDPIQISQNITP